MRFDDADYRDSTLALLLSSELLHDEIFDHFAVRPLDGLLRLRLANDAHGPGLWCTACTVDGNDVPAGFPNGPDVLASRYVLQTLLAGYLVKGDANLFSALNAAATTLGQVKRDDGVYDRFLDPTAAADVARSLGGDGAISQPFFAQPAATQPAKNDLDLSNTSLRGSFGVAATLDAAVHLKSMGREKYLAMLSKGLSWRAQVEACLCGLSDDPMSLVLPQTETGITAFLDEHSDLWPLAEGPAPDDLTGRVRRLWILYIRAKLERSSDSNK